MGEKNRETRKKKDTTTAAWATEKSSRAGGSMRRTWRGVMAVPLLTMFDTLAPLAAQTALDGGGMRKCSSTHPSSRCARHPRCPQLTRCRP